MNMTKLTNINLKSIKTLSCYMFLEKTISKQSIVIHSLKPVCWDKPCKRMSHNGEYKGRGGECQVQLARQAWSHHLRQPFQKDKNEEKAQGTIKNLRSLSYRYKSPFSITNVLLESAAKTWQANLQFEKCLIGLFSIVGINHYHHWR